MFARQKQARGVFMKTRSFLIPLILLVALSFTFSACSGGSGGDTATISISLGAGSLPDKATVSIDQLRHVLVLSGPTGTQTYSITGGGTVKATVAPGIWSIDVEAFLGNDLYAKGSASAEVRIGRTTNVTIFMVVVWGTGTAGGVGGSVGGGNPWTATVATWDELYAKVDEINSAGGGSAVILITQPLSVVMSTNTPAGYIEINSGTNITLMATSSITIDRDSGYTNQFFQVNGGKLTLGLPSMSGSLSLEGSNATSAIIKVMAGELVMNNGVKLSGNKWLTSGAVGGAVYVDGSGCKFTMNGGIISDNEVSQSGGGVYVNMGGDFTMTGGTIGKDPNNSSSIGNKAPFGGGVHFSSSGILDISGGKISDNEATSTDGGGVHFALGTFNMSGGTISDNKAALWGGGVYAQGIFNMSSGIIGKDPLDPSSIGNTASAGGGVYLFSSVLDMSGGTIGPENKATDPSSNATGGGVYAGGSTSLNLSGTATIHGNTAETPSGSLNAEGGGVYFDGTIFNMGPGGNPRIYGNKATNTDTSMGEARGGGVYIANGTLTMSAGQINNNGVEAIYLAHGGGVYNFDARFVMNLGDIKGNYTLVYPGGASRGGGVYVQDFTGAAPGPGSEKFVKNGGTIDGCNGAPGEVYNRASDTTPANIINSLNPGHAVFVNSNWYTYSPFGMNADAPPALDSNSPTVGWDF